MMSNPPITRIVEVSDAALAPRPLERVLVANRGEIACRVIRTLRRLGLVSIAVYSDADVDARHVREADLSVRIGPAPAAQSYLDIDAVIAAARSTDADAVHPGYGFLSENAQFAAALSEAGIVFIGPSAEAISTMGDKISARATVAARGVPVVPGVARPGLTDAELVTAAVDIGFPVLIKPSAGGGGKGMHLVEDPADLPDALARARRQAQAAFADDSLLLERFVDTPRHIEVQILADEHGNVIHLGERECSLQRRHQKVIEEAPSPLIDDVTRTRIGGAACDAARSVGYTGAGTVEFIVSGKRGDEFFFMEMNTRLQVEHPVTEMITGIDLVEAQVRISRGEVLDIYQGEVVLTGYAIEARVYAEDPANDFLPTGGTILALEEPCTDLDRGVRLDSSMQAGMVVGADYDPMLAKVIARGPTRAEAIARLDDALARTRVLGVVTNIDFCRHLLADPDVVAGRLDTGLLARILDRGVADAAAQPAAAVAMLEHIGFRDADDPWVGAVGFRLSGRAQLRMSLAVADQAFVVSADIHHTDETVVCGWVTVVPVEVLGAADSADSGSPGSEWSAAVEVRREQTVPSTRRHVIVDGVGQDWDIVTTADECWLAGPWGTRAVRTVRADRGRTDAVRAGEIVSPMPGTVVQAKRTGDVVAEGDVVVVVEAMKMEHTLRAPRAGRVEVAVSVAERVGAGAHLAQVEPEERE